MFNEVHYYYYSNNNRNVTSFKLLGVYIDSTMSWTIHVDNMAVSYTHLTLPTKRIV